MEPKRRDSHGVTSCNHSEPAATHIPEPALQ
ncbi:hypothetical protein E2C01_056661 [Portunus trituberculatus]|uniref:Uncharacterized protein n=1 Tax=Portunus trituberculatus TaxID=210409 RepID=A0A5B7GYU2_PORTR|nr:hypothetical protein [Portunus trituberculatus]